MKKFFQQEVLNSTCRVVVHKILVRVQLEKLRRKG
jgi:hypothetical protein